MAAHNTANNQVEFLLRSVKNISSVYVDRKNRVYAVTGEPYNILYASDNAATTNSNFQQAFPFGKTKSNFYLEFNEDISGNVWISSSNGLARFSFSTGSDLFKSHKNEPFSLSRNEIDNFYIGNDNVLWVSPIRQGINKADLYQKPFNHILPLSVSDTGSEPNVNVSSVYAEPNGNIWMGMNNNKVCVYVANEKKMYQTIIPSDNITSIFDDGMGNIWFGSYSIFLHKGVKSSIVWDKKSAQFRFAKLEKYNTMGVRKIARDSVGNMWFASSLGLVCKPFASNQFINYSQQLDSLNNFSTFYRYVFVDKKQQIWTASNNGGLSSFNTKTHTFKHFLNSSTNSNSISSNRTYAIYQDKQGLLWVGTGSGLDIFNPITQTFTRAGNNGALSKYRIFSILPDTCGNLWLSSDLGIIRYNIKTKLNTFYGREQGLPVTEFHTTASGIGSNGNLYYGGIDGLLSFNPMQIHNNPIKPLPTITALRVANRYFSPGDSLNGRVLFNKAIHKVNTLIFKYNEVDFSIEFSALHYAAPENCTYQYMLKGFNNEWQYTNASNRQVSYTGLPHGNYVFMLNAFNNDGLANDPEKMVRLNIIITPPFWRTIWFRIIVFLFIVIAISLSISFRIRVLKNQNKELESKVKLRTIELENSNIQLVQRSNELSEANAVLEERQEEINTQKEEIFSQLITLKSQQGVIVEQNKELFAHRAKLEVLVAERTRDLVKALEKAEESDQLKSSFLANLTHELRTPLNAILGFSRLLCATDDLSVRDEYAAIIELNSNMLMNLVADVLELATFESHQMQLSPRTVNLYTLISNVYTSFVTQANQKNISLNTDIRLIADNYVVSCDEIRLIQVMNYLLSNALKFTQSGGVTFGVYKVDNQEHDAENTNNNAIDSAALVNAIITFYVQDTGIGIDNSIGDKVFDRFYKIETDKDNLYRGTGLGLTLCKYHVNLWNGNLWYNSVPGQGSTFYFTLPLKTDLGV